MKNTLTKIVTALLAVSLLASLSACANVAAKAPVAVDNDYYYTPASSGLTALSTGGLEDF